jgi:hypothetical protein
MSVKSIVDTAPAIDVAVLASRLARPQHPRVIEASTAVEGATSGEQAWQWLFARGLLPMDLFRSTERRFAVVDTERHPAAAGGDDLAMCEAPNTVEAAVALASDAENVLESERLVRMLRSRLVAWGARPVEQINWIIVTHQIPFSFAQGPALNCAIYSLEYALEGIDVEFRTLGSDCPELPSFVNDVIRANRGWAAATSELLEVPSAYGASPKLVRDGAQTLGTRIRCRSFWQ